MTFWMWATANWLLDLQIKKANLKHSPRWNLKAMDTNMNAMDINLKEHDK